MYNLQCTNYFTKVIGNFFLEFWFTLRSWCLLIVQTHFKLLSRYFSNDNIFVDIYFIIIVTNSITIGAEVVTNVSSNGNSTIEEFSGEVTSELTLEPQTSKDTEATGTSGGQTTVTPTEISSGMGLKLEKPSL